MPEEKERKNANMPEAGVNKKRVDIKSVLQAPFHFVVLYRFLAKSTQESLACHLTLAD